MPSVALVTYEAFPDLYPDDRLLADALTALGVTPVPAVWSREHDWHAFDAVVIRSPWDYFERLAEFRGWLDRQIADGVRLINGGDVLRWNFDKGYLRELGARGVALVPTLCVDRGQTVDLPALVRERGWDDIVIKPTIAGGAYRTHRFPIADYPAHAAGIEETLRDRGLLVQPFLPEIVSGGELSLLFFDGVFSHAVHKRPAAGDFRVQLQFGGTLAPTTVSPALVDQARACLGHTPSPTTYARVDGVVKDGDFLLMELEVFEPLMYLANHPEAAHRFARAIISKLGR